MSLQLFGLLFSGLLFSSYTWKVLTALSADETPFENGDEHPPLAVRQYSRCWLTTIRPEATCIIEHLAGAPSRAEPLDSRTEKLGRRVRFLDRVFDLRVMAKMQAVVFDALRPAEHRRPLPTPQHKTRAGSATALRLA